MLLDKTNLIFIFETILFTRRPSDNCDKAHEVYKSYCFIKKGLRDEDYGKFQFSRDSLGNDRMWCDVTFDYILCDIYSFQRRYLHLNSQFHNDFRHTYTHTQTHTYTHTHTHTHTHTCTDIYIIYIYNRYKDIFI